jgi:hypothetical protein
MKMKVSKHLIMCIYACMYVSMKICVFFWDKVIHFETCLFMTREKTAKRQKPSGFKWRITCMRCPCVECFTLAPAKSPEAKVMAFLIPHTYIHTYIHTYMQDYHHKVVLLLQYYKHSIISIVRYIENASFIRNDYFTCR